MLKAGANACRVALKVIALEAHMQWGKLKSWILEPVLRSEGYEDVHYSGSQHI